jgi:hypothetical protein
MIPLLPTQRACGTRSIHQPLKTTNPPFGSHQCSTPYEVANKPMQQGAQAMPLLCTTRGLLYRQQPPDSDASYQTQPIAPLFHLTTMLSLQKPAGANAADSMQLQGSWRPCLEAGPPVGTCSPAESGIRWWKINHRHKPVLTPPALVTRTITDCHTRRHQGPKRSSIRSGKQTTLSRGCSDRHSSTDKTAVHAATHEMWTPGERVCCIRLGQPQQATMSTTCRTDSTQTGPVHTSTWCVHHPAHLVAPDHNCRREMDHPEHHHAPNLPIT